MSARPGSRPFLAAGSAAAVISAISILATLLLCRPSFACTGTACIQIWSTAAGGGTLVVYWDPTKTVQTFESFCAPDNSQCLYSTIDPGFMAPPNDPPPAGLFRIVDGTRVRIEIVHADTGLDLEVNGRKLYQPGDSALLGTMSAVSPIHTHPAWQLVLPGNVFGNYTLMYKLTADATYTESAVYSQIVTNIVPPPGTPTPTPAPTPVLPACPGDCDSSGEVSIDELVTCVGIALETRTPDACAACDANGDGAVAVDDVIAAVNAALSGCPTPAAATLAEIQRTIFTPSCALPTCHDVASHVEDLVLAEGMSYGQLVGVPPAVSTARDAGLLRVKPGVPDESFLLIKINGPPLGQGSRMPLTGALLTASQVQLITNWILQGAQP